MYTTLGAPSGALCGSNGVQSGSESRMSTLIVPLNGSLLTYPSRSPALAGFPAPRAKGAARRGARARAPPGGGARGGGGGRGAGARAGGGPGAGGRAVRAAPAIGVGACWRGVSRAVQRSGGLPQLAPIALRIGDPAEPADTLHVLRLFSHVRPLGAQLREHRI